MLTALVLAAISAGLSPPAPAPLPDRWLLKLLPDKLPPLPDRFYTETWYHHSLAPRIGINWELWAGFRKPGQGRRAEAILTLPDGVGTGFGHHLGSGLFSLERMPAKPGHRNVPLAVHGPLVEFNRRLYTATIRTSKAVAGQHAEREMLHLGSAIEVKDLVWYQAGTVSPKNGKGPSVEEWLIEFKDDPRTSDRGKAILRGHWRVLTEPEGESYEAEVPYHSYRNGRRVDLLWTGMFQPRSMQTLKIGGAPDGANVMEIEGMHQLSLYPAPKPRPELAPETVELVQPPGKKVRK